MLLHHVLSVTFLSVGLYLGVSGTELVATIFGTETTSIILNVCKYYVWTSGSLCFYLPVGYLQFLWNVYIFR